MDGDEACPSPKPASAAAAILVPQRGRHLPAHPLRRRRRKNQIPSRRSTSSERFLLTAGDGNVVEKIDLSELAKEGAPPLQFLQPAYLCSCSRASFRSVFCDASAMSWARAPFAYRTYALKDVFKPAILCLSGRTNVWRERLEPGESRDFALGNVIAVTVNIVAKLRPRNQILPRRFQDRYRRGFRRGKRRRSVRVAQRKGRQEDAARVEGVAKNPV